MSTEHTLEHLNQPISRDAFHPASWRDAAGSRTPESDNRERADTPATGHRSHKRTIEELDEDYKDDADASSDRGHAQDASSASDSNAATSYPSASASAQSAAEIRVNKRPRRAASKSDVAAGSREAMPRATPKSTKLTAQDMRAAKVLLDISQGQGGVEDGDW